LEEILLQVATLAVALAAAAAAVAQAVSHLQTPGLSAQATSWLMAAFLVLVLGS